MEIKLTEKNMWTVAGHINKFFKKQTKYYKGELYSKVKTEDVKYTGCGSYNMPIRELQKVYTPFQGECVEHHIRKAPISNFKNIPLLAIQTPYASICHPIYISDTIEIKGNSLSIRHIPDKKRMKKKTTIDLFVHEEYSTQDLLSELSSNLFQGLDFLGMDDKEYTWEDKDKMTDIEREILYNISKLFNSIQYISGNQEFLVYKKDEFKVNFSIDIKNFEKGKDSWSFEVFKKNKQTTETTSIVDVLEFIVNPEFEEDEDNEEFEDDDINSEDDYTIDEDWW